MTVNSASTKVLVAVTLMAAMVALGAAATTHWPGSEAGKPAPKVKGMPAGLEKNLATFDDLDFRVYSTQKWEDFRKSHAKDIVVHYPDGHTTTGLEAHISELKPLFTFAPDAKITVHPIRFGTGDAEWTAVAGQIEGTFSRPMVQPDGTSIPATGKSFKLPMATLGHWNKDGVMSEEYLYWDNAALMKQIGLGQ